MLHHTDQRPLHSFIWNLFRSRTPSLRRPAGVLLATAVWRSLAYPDYSYSNNPFVLSQTARYATCTRILNTSCLALVLSRFSRLFCFLSLLLRAPESPPRHTRTIRAHVAWTDDGLVKWKRGGGDEAAGGVKWKRARADGARTAAPRSSGSGSAHRRR